MRKGKDPEPVKDPYRWLMDPNPGGAKTFGSGSPTLPPLLLYFELWCRSSSARSAGAQWRRTRAPYPRRTAGSCSPNSMSRWRRSALSNGKQCCGSRISYPGSRIPNSYFWELSDDFLGKKFYNSLKFGPKFFLQQFKNKIILNFVKFLATKKVWQQFLLKLFLDPGPGWVKTRIRDPG